MASDPKFQPHFHQLGDLRAMTSVQVTGAGVRSMSGVVPFGAGSRRAIVVSSDAAYGLMRMFQAERDDDPDQIEVFRDLDAALTWLGLASSRTELLQALARAPHLAAIE